MGLLDDAIREHLELKRLKGANPGDLAREEQEALGEDASAGHAEAVEQARDREINDKVSSEHGQSQDRGEIEDDSSTHAAAAQETIELDMDSVLASSPRAEPRAAEAGSDAAEDAPRGRTPDPGESLEWEMPPGEDVQDGHASADDLREQESIDDVLEETPDFLRDTPEQDRLWFEQRPPRDFDFNE